jgi:hypothetical protein
MKYAVEMGSGAMTFIPNFTETDSGILKLAGGYTQTHRDSKVIVKAYLYIFFRNKETRLHIQLFGNHHNVFTLQKGTVS